MANIQAISYQTSTATTALGLDKTDHRFVNAALRIHFIARDVFHIIQEGDVTASITADRIVIVHNAQQHTLNLSNGQLTVDGQPIDDDSIYHAFGYLQGLLKIEALPIAQIAQPSLAPSITRSPDGNTVNITLNMGNTSLDAGRHVEDLTQLLKSTFETALGAQQRNIDTLTVDNRRLITEIVPHLQRQIDEFERQHQVDQESLSALTAENGRLTTETTPQLQQRIEELEREKQEADEKHRRELEELRRKIAADQEALQAKAAAELLSLE